jgi:hypothetical protein
MVMNEDLKHAKYHRVTFLQGGKPTSIVFPGYVLAYNFSKTLHSSRKARIEAAPELENRVVESSAPDRPAGTIVQCPRGPKVRTWLPRRPRTMRRYPDFSKNVMNIPRQSAGFAMTFPEQPSPTFTVIAQHPSVEEARSWASHKYGTWADGEWWPKDEKAA